MSDNFEIIPTILTSDSGEIADKIKRVEGILPRVQIDIIDGKFAEKRTVGIEALKSLEEISKIGIDLHLMVEKPEEWVERCLEIFPERIVAQVERMNRTGEFIEKVVENGIRVGIALDLETEVEILPEEIYNQCDLILIMSVPAGKSGQEFCPKALGKIKKIKSIVGDLVEIGVDGGLNEENILYCKEAGANVFYVGNSFWLAEDLGERYEILKRMLEKS